MSVCVGILACRTSNHIMPVWYQIVPPVPTSVALLGTPMRTFMVIS